MVACRPFSAATGLLARCVCGNNISLGNLDVEWSTEFGELFSRSQIQIRMETRIGESIYQPAAIYRRPPQAA